MTAPGSTVRGSADADQRSLRGSFPLPHRSRLSQLWQFPLLLASLGLFGYAAYLFIDPQPGLTVAQKIDVARAYLRHDRAEAAIEQLNGLLVSEKLVRDDEASVHLLLGEALERAQKQRRVNIPVNHQRIIEQTQIALGQGAMPSAEIHRRLAESYEALDRPTDALSHYRQAMAMDPDGALKLHRKVISMQIAGDNPMSALPAIEEYLAVHGLTAAERAWALGEKAQLLIDQGHFVEAKALLAEALRLDNDPVSQGQVNFRLGYCAWKLSDVDEAERLLRVARDQLRVHPLDADAAYVLGRIHQGRGQSAEAISFYQAVLVSHPDASVAPLARMGRGICRIRQGEDEAGLSDLQELADEMGRKQSRMRLKDEVLAGLRDAASVLSAKENYQGALEVMAHEQQLEPAPPGSFFARLAGVYARRADQVERTVADAPPAESVRRTQLVRDCRIKAGDAMVAYSRALILSDDKGYGDALWKGIELYDQAADVQCVIAALELFVAERPDDRLAADALLRLGQAYQAAGMFDKAVAAYQQNQFRHPNSLAASKSAVPLAQALIAKGPEAFEKAEKVLLGVVDDNPLLTPDAEEFHEALFELAQLYYRTERYEESIARLEELTERYPDDPRLGQLLFLMADGYRKSAALLDGRLASTGEAANKDAGEVLAAKRERLTTARALYDRVIELYRAAPPSRDLDKLHYKLAHFYRADCLYDLGEYAEAIRLYDAAAFRYQDDASALAAYVQIVNAYCALGKIEEAKTANERAKWLLKKMPPESFNADGGFTMPKSYWEQWMKWTTDAGMW